MGRLRPALDEKNSSSLQESRLRFYWHTLRVGEHLGEQRRASRTRVDKAWPGKRKFKLAQEIRVLHTECLQHFFQLVVSDCASRLSRFPLSA